MSRPQHTLYFLGVFSGFQPDLGALLTRWTPFSATSGTAKNIYQSTELWFWSCCEALPPYARINGADGLSAGVSLSYRLNSTCLGPVLLVLDFVLWGDLVWMLTMADWTVWLGGMKSPMEIMEGLGVTIFKCKRWDICVQREGQFLVRIYCAHALGIRVIQLD